MTERTTRIRPSTLIAVAIIMLLIGAGAIARFFTDILWYESVAQAGVFWRSLAWSWATGAVFALAFFAALYVNLLIARGMRPARVLRPADHPYLRIEVTIQEVRDALDRYAGRVLFAAAAAAAVISGLTMSESWQTFALALNGEPFGVSDPQFGRDIGFYMFSLPALELLRDWMAGSLLFTLAASAAIHVLNGSIRPWDRWRGFDPHVKAHLSVIGGLLVLTQAFGYWLDIYGLNFSPRGTVVGASYTDVYAQLPAYRMLIVIALLSGLALIVNIRFRGWRLPAIALGVWIAAAVLVGGVYPGLVQQFRVAPNEVEAEQPFIERNIAATRAAFGIGDVEVRAFAATDELDASGLAANAGTIDNVRLWDPTIAVQTFRQLQGIRPYYDFTDVDIDRYVIDGVMRQVLISVREMNISRLASQAQTWVNQHLVYTHGYGVVVSPVNESSGQGYPRFIVKDIPPDSDTDLVVSQPAIYFGEQTTNYVIAATDLPEFDYPIGDANAETSYAGSGGIAVGGPLRRVAFAMRFSAPQILFSGYIRPDSQVLFRRSVAERLEAIAPWLTVDADPYPVIVDGRIVWVIDGYTHSDRYPYSQRYGGINYVRNSVKITVDAYDGTTTFYAFDAEDPLLAAWDSVFPGLLTDASEMPVEIVAHLRYPADLFSIQGEVYKTYHMRDPRVFYNKEDQWALPGEGADGGGTPMNPFYVLMNLPDEAADDFMLMLPFTPRTKANMIGWMAAKSDPGTYGERIVYTFPKQRLVLGPDQVAARMNQDPLISQQLTLWTQRGSSVIFGNLLVIPIEDSVVYIQPLYLQAEQTAMPQLTRVIVTYADAVVMEPDLPTALSRLFGDAPVVTEQPGGTVDPARAKTLFDQAIEAQKAGDWAAYGRIIDELGVLLGELADASAEPTATP